MLSQLSIAKKMYVTGGIQLLLITLLGGFSFMQMDKIGDEVFDIAEEDIPLTNMLTAATEHQLEQAIYFERAIVISLLIDKGLESPQNFAKAQQKVTDYALKTQQELEQTRQFIEQAIPKLHTEEAKAEFNSLLAQVKSISAEYALLITSVNQVLTKAKGGDINAMLKSYHQVEALEDKIDMALIAALTEIQQFTLDSALSAEKHELFAIKWISVIWVVALLTCILLSVQVTRSVRKPIINLISRLQHVAEGDGDLTVRLNEQRNDEAGSVAKAFNGFLSVLVDTISRVGVTADELGKSSESALNAMQRTLRNVEAQKKDIEHVSESINEMYSTTQEVAGNSQDASVVTDEVKKRVLDGRAEAQATLNEIQHLSQEVVQSSEVIQTLVSETNNIETVLASIQSIAEQTNLLALNAAIEAARAGDSGRGFAVVADEVRALAQRTQEATVDIQQLVGRLQTEAQNAVESMDRGTETAQSCLARSTSSAETLEVAAESVERISSLNVQIAQAAQQQSRVANELNDTLHNIRSMAEETTTETRNTAEASKVIAKNVISLHKNLNKFQIS